MPDIAHTWISHEYALGLSRAYRPELAWFADHQPPPSATRTLNQANTGFFRPSFSRFEQEISHDLLHFRQPSTLHQLSVYEEKTLTGTLIPCSVTPPHTLEGPARQILADRIQEAAFFPSRGASFARDESLLEHQRTLSGILVFLIRIFLS